MGRPGTTLDRKVCLKLGADYRSAFNKEELAGDFEEWQTSPPIQ